MNRLEIVDNLVEENLGGALKYITDSNGDSYLTEESQELYNTEFGEIENMFLHLEELTELDRLIRSNHRLHGNSLLGFPLSPEEIEEFYINKVMPFDKRSLDEIIEEYMGAN